jgi:antitoxin (DNA-binding transcriptional repressor) of toxin-antitoxin stability system
MRTITIRDLHLETGRWVREAAQRRRIVVTDRGRPVAELSPFDARRSGKPLPDREARIQRRSRIEVDSTVYISDMREGR